MSTHLSRQQIADYGRQRLAPAALLAADDHLAGCAACRRLLEAALPGTAVSLHAGLQAAAETLSAARHLSFEQLANYVDEKLVREEWQFVNDHLVYCAVCAHALADLRAFKNEPAAPHKLARPPLVAAMSWREKLRRALWPRSPAFIFGGALALLFILALAGWWLSRMRVRESTTPEIAKTEASPSPSPSAAPAPAITPAPLLAQLNDGDRRVTLDQQGTLTGLDDLPPAWQQMVQETLSTQRLKRPASLAGLHRAASSLMGADEQGHKFSLTAPVSKVVLTDRPTFTWTQLSQAQGYVVEVYDEQFNLVTKSEELQANQWSTPRSLARGRLYAWQVRALKGGQEFVAPKPPAPQARFRVLGQEQAREIARAQRIDSASPLTLGLLYAQAGLLDEAARELSALQQANPDSTLVRRLRASLQTLWR